MTDAIAVAKSGINLEELTISIQSSMTNKMKRKITKARRILYSFFICKYFSWEILKPSLFLVSFVIFNRDSQ